MSLLQNPVISGLLGGGGPNAIRAQYDQQRAAMAPRASGGMMGAPGAIVTRDNSSAELGQGLAGLGKGLSAIGDARRQAKEREALEAAIAGLPPEMQAAARVAPEAAVKAMLRKDDLMKPVTIGEGQILFDPKTGRQIAAGPAKPDNLTSTRRDYDYAVQQYAAGKGSYPGSFTKFIADTRASTTERAPQGYEKTPTGLQPISGGPADPKTISSAETAKKTATAEAEKRAMFPKAQSALKSLEMSSQLVLDAIDKADKEVGWSTTGVAGALLKNWPASDAYDLRQTIDTIRANVGFDNLAQMRENSPTGGALGNVSENENRLLQAVKGSLDPNQSAEQLRENLGTIKKYYKAVLDERRKAFLQDYGDMIPKEAAPSGTDAGQSDVPPPPPGFSRVN